MTQEQQQFARTALRHRILANRAIAIVLLAVIGLTAYLWFHESGPQQHELRMTAGDRVSHRHHLAELLCEGRSTMIST